MENNYLQELHFYLTRIKSLAGTIDLSKPIYKEGTTAGQIAFHVAEATNYWLQVVILKRNRARNREAEFIDFHTKEEILASINEAIRICDEMKNIKLDLEEKLDKPTTITLSSTKIEITTLLMAFIHAIAHTAEHYGELNISQAA